MFPTNMAYMFNCAARKMIERFILMTINLFEKPLDFLRQMLYNVLNNKCLEEVMEILAERLRTLREGMGISQAKLAKEIGVTQASVNRYETDKTTPTVETLLWYAERFDVSMDYIFGRTDNPQGKQYNYLPKMDNSEEFVEFIEMCFDPKSPFNGRLKQALLELLNDT